MNSLVREGRRPGAMITRRVAGSLMILAAVAGCTSSPAPAPSSSPVAGSSVTRWWSNPAATAGSVIDPAHPVTSKLHPSRAAYCTMVRQTVAAGRSVLPGASDASRAVATTAFLAELTAVAPAAVASSWRVLEKTLLSLVAAHGNAAAVQADTAAVSRAVATVAADARSQCGVNLSR